MEQGSVTVVKQQILPCKLPPLEATVSGFREPWAFSGTPGPHASQKALSVPTMATESLS
jgi:hypothetical protein